MSEQWPPPGHAAYYKFQIVLDNGYKLTFEMSLPRAVPILDLATLRIGRHGGPSEADRLFREQLYSRVGAITVASGHVESAMKRILLLLKGTTGQFSLADKTWSQLHKALVRESRRPDARCVRLQDVIAWGEQKGVKRRRDNVIHACWWNFDDCCVVRSRFFRREDGTLIVSSLEDLEEDAEVLFEYASRLDDLVDEDWGRAMLPSWQMDGPT